MKWWWLDVVSLVLLATVSLTWFTWHHAYGAYGDDSPGYIYAAHQLLSGQALVQIDPLVQDALAWFGQEPWARFVAPAHHEIISPAGWTVSRYPLGLSVLMAGVAWLAQDPLAIYWVVPVLAVGVVMLTYVGAVTLLPIPPAWRRVSGIGAALIVLGSNLFFTYSVAQPMREIPALFFFLGAALLFVKTKRWYWLALAGTAFGYSVAIRETNLILIIPLVLYHWRSLRQGWLVFSVGAILIYSPFLLHAANITQHKEAFREKDITSIAVTSNIDHLQSFHLSNLWNNQGKFKPGVGGLNQYWDVIQQFSPWPIFLLTIAVGIIYLWKHDRRLAGLLASWVVGVVVVFALWINPYPRYILPILPVLAWLSMVGMWQAWTWLSSTLRLGRFTSLMILLGLVGSFVAAYQPVLASRQAFLLTGTPQDRELTAADLATLQSTAAAIQADSLTTGQPALLLMLGDTKGGLAETIMSHTTLRVIRWPNKDKEQPPFDQLQGYINHLDETATIYLWYDPSVTADEQRFYNAATLTPISLISTSFKSEISILRYAVTAAH